MPDMSSDALDPRLVEVAHACFDFARLGDVERLTAYIDKGVPVDLTDASGNTLLMLAAYHGQTAAVTALLERGAEVNRLNDRGQSPLAGAVFKGEDTIVWLLMDAGADINIGNPSAQQTAEMFGRGDLTAR